MEDALMQEQLSKIEVAINQAKLGWTLCFIGEDQSDKLAVLTEDLQREFSLTGDGKQITSGFSYWGIVPTNAWRKACTDPFYRVMKRSINTFGGSWDEIKSVLGGQRYHYVSLGVGTGQKDFHILSHLVRQFRGPYFFPVDMSPEMLRVGIQGATQGLELDRHKILPIQIDFSLEANVAELRGLLNMILGEEPVLFSLLGNTLANFELDAALLKTLAELIRPQDRFLLELASTNTLTDEACQQAAKEYAASKSFRKFALGALYQNANFHINKECVEISPSMEKGYSICIKTLYGNRSGVEEKITLPDESEVDFPVDDTIRLYLSRKYTKAGIDRLLRIGGFRNVQRPLSIKSSGHDSAFGIELMLLERSRIPGDQLATWDIFLSHASPDIRVAEQLYELLEPHCEVFLDRRALLISDDWDLELAAAQSKSLITVVLVSSNTENAYYQREEIAAAIKMARMDSTSHRVVPIYLDERPTDESAVPYGLRLKHGISVPEVRRA